MDMPSKGKFHLKGTNSQLTTRSQEVKGARIKAGGLRFKGDVQSLSILSTKLNSTWPGRILQATGRSGWQRNEALDVAK